MLELMHTQHFPQVYSLRKLPENSYIVIEKLDFNLEDLFLRCKRQFSLQTVALIIDDGTNFAYDAWSWLLAPRSEALKFHGQDGQPLHKADRFRTRRHAYSKESQHVDWQCPLLFALGTLRKFLQKRWPRITDDFALLPHDRRSSLAVRKQRVDWDGNRA